MQNLLAALALGLAGLIIWRSWWTVVVRHSPALAARVRAKRSDDLVEMPAPAPPAPWFAPPVSPVLDLKAARVRTEPAAGTEATPQVGRRAGWNGEDDAELLRLLAEDRPAAEIAARLGRSEKSVLLRIPLLRLRQRQTVHKAGTSQTS
jgi:hypothetical protein